MYIHLNVSKQITDTKLLLLHINTWKDLTVCKKGGQVRLELLSTKCIKILYEFNIYV